MAMFGFVDEESTKIKADGAQRSESELRTAK
jgi:hypothetical protein